MKPSFMRPINRSSGNTPTERYLAKVCDKTFLSLWSYPNLYTSEGRKNNKGAGKELCDLLVVFGNDILIFSDKDVKFNSGIDIGVAWKRWRKKSIVESAKQLWGAEKWIREHAAEIYLDETCSERFPLNIPATDTLSFHLIAVTKNSNDSAKQYFGGVSSGSFMLLPDLSETDTQEFPFSINDINPNKTFVHVLDELTLDALFSEFDTAYDFIRYLSSKEKAIRSGQIASVAGEEDLVAYYMENGGLINNEPFTISDPELAEQFSGIAIAEGFWLAYLQSQDRSTMRKANSQSYFWDSMIENFAKHIRAGTVGVSKHAATSSHEEALRHLAAQGRLARRSLAESFLDKLKSTPHNHRSGRVCFPPFSETSCFVLVLYPRDKEEPYEAYRTERIQMLHAYGLVCKYKFAHVKKITLVGMEPLLSDGRSEDLLTMEIDELSDDEKDLAKRLMEEDNILNEVRYIELNDSIAPRRTKAQTPSHVKGKNKTGRNDPCPCGSGMKFKRCCYK